MLSSITALYHSLPAKLSRFATAVVVLLLLASATLAHADDREIVSRIKPTTPEIAKRMKITGQVLLNVTVEANGKVKAASSLMGHHMLTEAAKAAVMKWKFAPAENETIEQVEINFQ